MNKYRIALLPGDGVGPELLKSACRVLDEVQKNTADFRLEFVEYPFGKQALDDFGAVLPDQTLEGVRMADAVLIGAVNTGDISGLSPLGRIRKELNLFADVRPVKTFPGVWSLKPNIDLVCIRENMEGFLADRNLFKGYGEFMPTEDTVVSLRLLTREGCERISRFAFEYARQHQRKRITAVHKCNVLKMGCGFFLEIVRQTAREYPDIELKDEYIDNVAHNLIKSPDKYDVILTTNLFGDIISDEASALVSGLVPTGNIGQAASVFLPVNHNPRYEAAGKNIINPLPMILCAGMMLGHLGE
ncbi:MAG: isocitrate/isopropylmalate dehydrogenase family protein, partial [Bacteroidota bacterium]